MKNRIFIPFALVGASLFAQAPFQAPKPSPEHQLLGMWVGAWTGEWVGKENPFGLPVGIYPFKASGEWLDGRFHVLMRWHYAATSPTGAYQELAIFGYDPEKKQQVLYDFDSFGTQAEFRGSVTGKIWSYKSIIGSPAWHRMAITEQDAKRCTWTNEYSKDGQTWTAFGEGKMTKK